MRLKVTVSYDGTDFDGWQRQNPKRTIQQTLEDAVSKVLKIPTKITGSGRTDAGVHAYGQVFHFDSHLDIPDWGWIRALNSCLPDDIRIREVAFVPETFSARYSAISKTYHYTINTGEYNVLERNSVYQLGLPLDIEKMREAISHMLGTHDFTSFNATPLEHTPNQIRTIQDIRLEVMGEKILIEFKGKSFLRYMVRMIVSALVEVGLDRIPVNAIPYALKYPSKNALTGNSPPCGLALMHVEYGENENFTEYDDADE